MANHTPEQNILDRLNHLADGLDNLRNNSKDDYDRGYIGAMIEEVELMTSLAPRIMVCVNACKGLSNEDLENGALFSAAGIELFGENNEIKILSKQLSAVAAQRDELKEQSEYVLRECKEPEALNDESLNICNIATGIRDLRAELEEVTAQRDELLAALKSLDCALEKAWKERTLSAAALDGEQVRSYKSVILKCEVQS